MNQPTSDIVTMMNDISKIQEDSLLEKIATYCEQNNYDEQEVGDVLAESEQFKRKLYVDLVHKNVIKDAGFTKKDNLCADIDEW